MPEGEELKPFDFSDEIFDKLKREHSIPVHFYNKNGQILIHKKNNASDHEIDQLFKFKNQGIFFDEAEEAKLRDSKKEIENEIEGLSNTRLFDRKKIDDFKDDTDELFDRLKTGAVDAIFAKKAQERVAGIFEEFRNQEDMKTGLINILELLKNDNTGNFNSELAVKKTVIAMALKIRGLNAQNTREAIKIQKMVTILMNSALFSDIGKIRMNMPTHTNLSEKEFDYVRKFPLMSYLMIAHEKSIDPLIKRNILCQQCPLPEENAGNNYPPKKWLINNFKQLMVKHKSNPNLLQDLAEQIRLINKPLSFDEDPNILAMVSEYASLTSRVSWREAFSSKKAIQIMVNQSFYTYTSRAMREFLDYISMSLNNNEKIINNGDYAILALNNYSEKTMNFEISRIIKSTKFQSIPEVYKIAEIKMETQKRGKLVLAPPTKENLKLNVRRGDFLLEKDQSRRIVYILDEKDNEEIIKILEEAS